MFGLSFWEIALILAVALLVLGPSKLPELAKSLGKGIREFRRATDDFKSTMEDELNKPDPRPARLADGRAREAELLPASQPVDQAKIVASPDAHPVTTADSSSGER